MVGTLGEEEIFESGPGSRGGIYEESLLGEGSLRWGGMFRGTHSQGLYLPSQTKPHFYKVEAG
jgi:hypothetical protein